MRQKTLSVAESCTGGLLGSLITDTPGSSDYFLGGIIAYHNDIKSGLLSVPKKTLKKHGAVSAETAKSMARNVRKIFESDLGIAITGIAGPGGATAQKPVGLVYIALASKGNVSCKKYFFTGSRKKIKSQSAKSALKLLAKLNL